MEGVLSIDKPSGMTSHDVVNRVRRIAKMRRVGHAGTLDPLATGVLLLCLGRTTRLIEYLVGLPKVYKTQIRLGQTMDSYDADGQLIAEQEVRATQDQIALVLEDFRGEILQKPPMFSAIKRQGQPLYKLARQGVEVERPFRAVKIYDLQLLKYDKPFVDLQVTCSAGTYIRSLAHDLGNQLGCGGHVATLQRTAVGSFLLENAVNLNELTPESLDHHLKPSDQTVSHLPRLDLAQAEAVRLGHGQKVPHFAELPQSKLVRAYNEQGVFIGIVEAKPSYWQAKKIFHPA